jgi:hypothetical protein
MDDPSAPPAGLVPRGRASERTDRQNVALADEAGKRRQQAAHDTPEAPLAAVAEANPAVQRPDAPPTGCTTVTKAAS